MDSLSIICITFGVSTSFMIGSVLLIVGLNQLTDVVEMTSRNYVIATWIITMMAAVSAVSGLKLGIRRMSQLCFLSGEYIRENFRIGRISIFSLYLDF